MVCSEHANTFSPVLIAEEKERDFEATLATRCASMVVYYCLYQQTKHPTNHTFLR